MSWYDLRISPAWIIWPGVLQCLGMGTVFVPLSAMAYGSLRPEQADAGAGLFNLARPIGASMGVSIAATWYTRFGQMGWNLVGGSPRATPYQQNGTYRPGIPLLDQ